jgi:hypothetical protein
LRLHVELILLGLLIGCAPAAERAQHIDPSAAVVPSSSSTVSANRDSISPQVSASPDDHSLVRPGAIPSAVRIACDSASIITREALAIAPHREEGDYFDTRRETPRTGCRLVVIGSFKALPNESGPVDNLWATFKRHGWRHDISFSADGPDGSVVGMRLRSNLCIVTGRWDGGDDSDTTPPPPTEQDNNYEAIIECAQDIVSNKDTDVPDSVWRIASSAGLDSIYAISLSLQSPPYIEGDFDGDGIKDAAVVVEHRSSGKLGVAIVHRGTRRVTILGAGMASPGPDDLGWIDALDVSHKNSLNLTVGYRPNARLLADALWVGLREGPTGSFYTWNGHGFDYETHKK